MHRVLAWAVVAIASLVTGCASLPPLIGRTETSALTDTAGTRLGRAVAPATLDAHPNIEVRLYNPIVIRDNRALNFLMDFTRVNRRMHNKSFTADNQASVAGGRNIGNEYFGAGSGVGFADLDVPAVGSAVREVSKELDFYFVPTLAYEVRLAPDGSSLEWIERTSSGETRHDTEPGTTWATRMGVEMLSILPIEWLL